MLEWSEKYDKKLFFYFIVSLRSRKWPYESPIEVQFLFLLKYDILRCPKGFANQRIFLLHEIYFFYHNFFLFDQIYIFFLLDIKLIYEFSSAPISDDSLTSFRTVASEILIRSVL